MTQIESKGTALVTGAAKRIGKAIALHLATLGYDLGIHYHHSDEAAEETAEQIREIGRQATTIPGDLANADRCREIIAEARSKLGPLTVLVNNASRFEMDTLTDFTEANWDAHLETNLRAPAILSQVFAAQRPAGVQGNIINLIDQRVWNLTPFFISYTVSKSGLLTLTQTMAMALAPDIRVNAIGPGPTVRSQRQSEDHFEAQSASTPLGHGAQPQDIADTVEFILQASTMTGQMIALDGGQHLPWRPDKILDIE